jgi:hypothetical protein
VELGRKGKWADLVGRQRKLRERHLLILPLVNDPIRLVLDQKDQVEEGQGVSQRHSLVWNSNKFCKKYWQMGKIYSLPVQLVSFVLLGPAIKLTHRNW